MGVLARRPDLSEAKRYREQAVKRRVTVLAPKRTWKEAIHLAKALGPSDGGTDHPDQPNPRIGHVHLKYHVLTTGALNTMTI